MAEKIGKYRVFERIGRGGMGTIYKAHDPILDRPVALKVISSEVEVTDGLRARFFREAQACARLSHPNIVTVYDMGEEDGRLYIVMELLEGEELKRLIARRTAMTLEEKISVMAQVCDGLHYAHQKGVVHRDIKPGNIMLLRSGQVKILDFGIAHIANAEGDLTRTGLIMGTLRYIAPEQVRGRADFRSDIFSVGAVFYEFLSLQAPFVGDDPMQLLEQLRTEDPTPLDRLVLGIRPELAGLVERAMRKHPEERFANLQQMRAQIEQVQRGLTDEAQRIGARVRGQSSRLRELQAQLAERVGPLGAEETRPVPEQSGSVAALQALEREIDARIQSVQARIERADALAPAFERGMELVQAGQFADAEVELAAIVAEMPEHERAADGLRQARTGTEAERRRRLTAQLLQDARQALSEGQYTLCLEILEQIFAIPAPEEAGREIAALRETAEKLTAIQEARRARQLAEQSREKMAPARRAAQAEAAADYAPAVWNDAESKSDEAQKAVAAEQYADAGAAFEAAAAAYSRAAEAARDTRRQEREALDRARVEAVQSKEAARAAEATRYADELWDLAEFKFTEAEAAVRAGREVRAGAVADLFSAARRQYAAAARAARLAAEAEGRRVDVLLSEASALLASADAAGCLRRVNEVLALRPGDIAAERLRVQAEEQRAESAAAADRIAPAANVAPGGDHAPSGAEAASAADPTRVIAPPASVESAAEPTPADAIVLPPTAGPRARPQDFPFIERIEAVEPIDAEAETGWPWGRWARGILTVVAVLAVVVVASVYWLPRLTAPAAPPAQHANRATPSSEAAPPTVATPLTSQSGTTERDSVDEQRKQVSVPRDEATRGKAESRTPAAEKPAAEPKRTGERTSTPSVVSTPPQLPDRVVSSLKTNESRDKPQSRDKPPESRNKSPEPRDKTPEPRDKTPESRDTSTGARKNAEQTKARVASVRRAAEEVAAAFYAPKRFSSARSKEEEAAAALVRADYESAVRLFGEAQSEYQAAAQEAKPGADAARQEATVQESRGATIARRTEARAAGAERLAKEVFEAAQSKHVEADRLDKARDFSTAAQAYRDAAKLYQEATQASQR
jgi:predicted Ser/Thr protein kinase